ncbi:hypothetical protein T552_02282 [Pneumocystis carinii B80]|uniref:Kinesin-like protein n=1 Tax=Pneumocystis carinii (strain B80) TaxID=1408658 RepID=A0A0W4ZG25_PNEC8|nr:hypothetical protein T552_02282 [Pneumocystis carinii B80]KTW27300.1 hypothetical protein T552_02282 [Pneumocystis carinii B80]
MGEKNQSRLPQPSSRMVSPITRVKTSPLADSTSSVNIIPQRNVSGTKRSLKDLEINVSDNSKKKNTIVSERKTLVERAVAPRKPSGSSNNKASVQESSKSAPVYQKTLQSGLSRSLNGGHVRSISALGGNSSNMMSNSQTIQRPGAKTLGDRPKRPAWDTRGRLEDMEIAYSQLKEQISIGNTEKDVIITTLESERHKLNELEAVKKSLMNELEEVRSSLLTRKLEMDEQLSKLRCENLELERKLDNERRQFRNEMDDFVRKNRDEIESLERKHKDEVKSLEKTYKDEIDEIKQDGKQKLESLISHYKNEIEMMEKKHTTAIEEACSQSILELQKFKVESALEKQKADLAFDAKERELQMTKISLNEITSDLEREKILNASLRNAINEKCASNLTLESSVSVFRVEIEKLEAQITSQKANIEELSRLAKDAQEEKEKYCKKLREEETHRRKLHNQIQELKGNIRVFCRVRPFLEHENPENGAVDIKYPDESKEGKEIEILGQTVESSLGSVHSKSYPFSFDKVFSPKCSNDMIFDEISQLVQSALDGYNVCIFAYGQTGSGKTYTMCAEDGMIPRAVNQIYNTAHSLSEKGWCYSMEGQFLEIYNEHINDLLGHPDEFDKKKYEIRHDPKECRTTVTDLTTVVLDTPSKVSSILKKASNNRSVAATHANERSSRSHSVFILTLYGTNNITGETSRGTLNLIDLAGSERLSQSQSVGDRLKETQAINKSLSCLGDVISALSNPKGHVPYRNSKLTYLLQYSLGGHSKTLMLVTLSPLLQHLSESLCSLRFATKVNNTVIGTARKTTKVQNLSLTDG